MTQPGKNVLPLLEVSDTVLHEQASTRSSASIQHIIVYNFIYLVIYLLRALMAWMCHNGKAVVIHREKIMISKNERKRNDRYGTSDSQDTTTYVVNWRVLMLLWIKLILKFIIYFLIAEIIMNPTVASHKDVQLWLVYISIRLIFRHNCFLQSPKRQKELGNLLAKDHFKL